MAYILQIYLYRAVDESCICVIINRVLISQPEGG